jgi:acetyl-CoA carboxylase biotin carboxyl carrier protein
LRGFELRCKLSSHERKENRVGNTFDSLSDDEIRRVVALVETLEKSSFEFLQVEVGDLKVTIGKGQAPPTASAAPNVPTASPVAVAQRTAAVPAAPAAVIATPVGTPSSPERAADENAEPGTVAIVAPLLGRFYAQPEPGAPAFVSVGSEVTESTTVGLIEVMKTFNAVSAGVSGVVTEICVQDAQLVEYGQVLFRIRSA